MSEVAHRINSPELTSVRGSFPMCRTCTYWDCKRRETELAAFETHKKLTVSIDNNPPRQKLPFPELNSHLQRLKTGK